MPHTIETHLARLVEFKTVKDNVDEVQKAFEYIKNELGKLPYEVVDFESNDRHSVLWRAPRTEVRQNQPKILLNAHVDVVAGSEGLFTMRQDDEKLFGRGVSDMKFAIATFIQIAHDIHNSGEVLPDILITSDEEIGGANGVKYVLENTTDHYDVVIIPDGGDNWEIVEATKGLIHLKLEVDGEGAHGSRPWEGESAINLLLKDLARLRKAFPERKRPAWKATMNIGEFKGGEQTNQVADYAMAKIDVRFPPEPSIDLSEQLQNLEAKVRRLCKFAKVTIAAQGFPFATDRNNRFVKNWAEQLQALGKSGQFIYEHGASDARYFTEHGIPAIVSKPIGGLIHTEQEWISVESMLEYYVFFREYLVWCSQQPVTNESINTDAAVPELTAAITASLIAHENVVAA